MNKSQNTSGQSGDGRKDQYQKDSLSLPGAVAMGTGVMIGAGIFALTGQIAEHAGGLFPFAFLAAAVVTAFSAYSYVKMSNANPSAGGIAMYLKKAYGKGTITAGCALLMYFSMVINESLVARTFGTYTLQLFDIGKNQWLIPALGVGLLAFAFAVNVAGNRFINSFSMVTAVIKIGAITAFAVTGLWLSGLSFESVGVDKQTSAGGFLAAVSLGILAFKGFTTITNSGAELVNPRKNVSRAIMISILICVILYLLVAFAVGGNLSLDEITKAKDFVLAEAARPAFGQWGLWFTVALAIVATVSGIIASTFAVSRMLAMLTDMELVPHSHFGMPGSIQKHTLVYTIVFAMVLTIFFDLSRIAAIGAIFYIIMDMTVHWGILRHLRKELEANAIVLVTAIVLDVIVLGALLVVKWQSDAFVIYFSLAGLVVIFVGEGLFLKWHEEESE